VDCRTYAPLAHSWVAHPFRREGGAALDTLCHVDGGWKMRSYSNEKDIQWMQRTLADLKAKIEGTTRLDIHECVEDLSDRENS